MQAIQKFPFLDIQKGDHSHLTTPSSHDASGVDGVEMLMVCHAHLILEWEVKTKQSCMADNFVFMLFSQMSTLNFVGDCSIMPFFICTVQTKNGQAWPGDRNIFSVVQCGHKSFYVFDK